MAWLLIISSTQRQRKKIQKRSLPNQKIKTLQQEITTTQNRTWFMKKAIIYNLFILVVFSFSCGKRKDPESIYNDGGYKITSTFKTPGYAKDVLVDGKYCYIAQGEGGMAIVNISNPTQPVLTASLDQELRGNSIKVAKDSNIVYLTAGSFGFSSVDVSKPDTPSVVTTNINMKTSKSATIRNKFLFAAISERGVNIAKLDKSGSPDIRGAVKTQGFAQAVAVTTDFQKMFVACGEMGVEAFDISSFLDGYGPYPLLSRVSATGYSSSIALNEKAKLVLVGCENYGLKVYDYSSAGALKLIGIFETDNKLVEMKFDYPYAYLCLGKGGLQVVDLSAPTSMSSVARIKISNAVGVDFDQQYIYIATNEGGIVVVKKK
jgi:hypothetical protein